ERIEGYSVAKAMTKKPSAAKRVGKRGADKPSGKRAVKPGASKATSKSAASVKSSPKPGTKSSKSSRSNGKVAAAVAAAPRRSGTRVEMKPTRPSSTASARGTVTAPLVNKAEKSMKKS